METTPAFLLLKDHTQETIRENYWGNFHRDIPTPDFANNGNGIKLSEICLNLLKKGGGVANYNIEQVQWDMEISDVRQELAISAITPDGWDVPVTGIEQIDITTIGSDWSIDIRLELFEENL